MNGKRRISRFGMNNFWNAHKNLTPRVSFRAKNDTQLLTFQPWHFGRAVKRIALKFFRPRIPRSFNCHESKCARLIKELSFPCELWFFFLRWTCQSAALLRCSVETVVMSTRVASLSPNRFGFATLSFSCFRRCWLEKNVIRVKGPHLTTDESVGLNVLHVWRYFYNSYAAQRRWFV